MKYLVIDDHQLFFEGIKYALKKIHNDLELLYAANGEQGLLLIKEYSDIDMILLDLDLPDIKGVNLLEIFLQEHNPIPTVMISASHNPIDAYNAIQNGALGFICKNMNEEEIINAVKTVQSGKIYLPPHWREFIKNMGGTNNTHQRNMRVTPRQMEVLKIMSKGSSNKEIAIQLGLTEHTIKLHVRSLLQIMNTPNRTACIHEAIKMGLIN